MSGSNESFLFTQNQSYPSYDSSLEVVAKYPARPISFWFAILILVVGFIENGLVLIVAIGNWSKVIKIRFNILILNLCLNDFLFCIFVFPLQTVCFYYGILVFPEILCKCIGFFIFLISGTTVCALVIITINRAGIMLGSSNVKRKMTSYKGMAIMILMATVISLCNQIPFIFGISAEYGWSNASLSSVLGTLHDGMKIHSIFAGIFLLVLPITFMILTYVAILIKLKASSRTVRVHSTDNKMNSTTTTTSGPVNETKGHNYATNSYKREKQQTIIAGALVSTFLLAYLPHIMIGILDPQQTMPYLQEIVSCTDWLALVVRPFLYVLPNKQMLKAITPF